MSSPESVPPSGVLVDTNVLLWFYFGDSRLGVETRKLLETDIPLLFSVASLWEISIKYSIRKLDLADHPRKLMPRLLRETGVAKLPILPADTYAVVDLSQHHRDPFDRLIIAQAMRRKLPVLTSDVDVFQSYDDIEVRSSLL